MISQRTIDLLIGRKYLLGGDSIHSAGLDCLGMVKEFLRLEHQSFLPAFFNNVPVRTYVALFKTYPSECWSNIVSYLSLGLQEIPVSNVFVGDILLCSDEDSYSLTITLGNGTMIACVEGFGCMFAPASAYKRERGFRWVPVQNR